MVMTDESWYVIRNTRGVTGLSALALSPFLSDDEIRKMGVEDINRAKSRSGRQYTGYIRTLRELYRGYRRDIS